MKKIFYILIVFLFCSPSRYADNFYEKRQREYVQSILKGPKHVDPTIGAMPIEKIDTSSPPAPAPKRNVAYTVAITDLVKTDDEKVLNYLCTGENIRRAIMGAKQLGCPPSFLLAHDGVESNWGQSSLTQKTRNSGNIKCSCNGRGKRSRAFRAVHQKLADAGQPVCHQGFDKIEKSNHFYKVMPTRGHAWAEKIRILSGYKAIKRVQRKPSTVWQWCQAFQASPYSTDIHAAKTIYRCISNYGLDGIDRAYYEGMIISTTSGKYILWDPIP